LQTKHGTRKNEGKVSTRALESTQVRTREEDTAPAPASREDLPVVPGDLLLGRYRVQELIAEGGQSLVYRVDDERLHRPACAKVFHVPGMAADSLAVVERSFVGEAFLLSGLCDPGALQIYDFGYLPAAVEGAPPTPFQICELVNDGPLSSLVKRNGPLRPAEVLGVMLPICRALAELHRGGVVHLDVKPQNILLGRTARRPFSKLADFGIAQRIGSTPSMSPSALLMYSVNWAAPEQLIGETVSPGCDVYSLALVTVYALTGRLVFQETDGVQGYRVRRFADQIIRDLLAGCGFPAGVLALMLDACSFEPESRLTDVQEFGRRLEAAFDAPEWSAASDGDTTAVGPLGGAARDRSEPALDPWPADRIAAAHLWSLSPDRPCPEVAGRRLQFLSLAGEADVALPDGSRLRLSLLPAQAGRPGLHVKGLTCFVSAAGGRPSPAVTVHETTAVDLVSPRGESLALAMVSFAVVGPNKSVATLADHCLVIPGAADVDRPVVIVDFGAGNTCFIAQGPSMERAASETPRVAV
jgi:serine/threonine-protein kinase